MARQASPLDHHDVESHRQRGELRSHREKRLDGAGDAPALTRQ
jgi:hypothetical protein